MFDHEPKKMIRKDAVYNPIEGKWEKRSIRSNDYGDLPDLEDKLNVESVKPSSNLIKKLIASPWKKLRYIKRQQDLHDRKVYNGSESDYKAAKKMRSN